MRLLVLGGIRSGKSTLAEAYVADAERVRYVATALEDHGTDDPDWASRLAAHRARRPATWVTEEIGAEPDRLADLLIAAKPDDVLLVDDLGGWLNGTLRAAGDWSDPSVADAAIDGLVAAVRDCPAALLVLVGPEVGLTVMPMTEAGRTFADANGTLNQRVAAVCDGVALVVAGQATWLRGGRPSWVVPATVPAAAPRHAALAEEEAEPFVFDGARAGAAVSTLDIDDALSFQPGMELPLPDEEANSEAGQRLLRLAFPGPGLGALVPVVRFAAGVQGRPDPRPFQTPRVLLLRGDHAGAFSAGASPAAADQLLADALEGTGTLAMLAAAAGASVQTVECPAAGPAEHHDCLDDSSVDSALTLGWRLAEAAANEGVDLLVLAACGAGGETAAAAVTAISTGGEPAALLGRVVDAAGNVDDTAWMRRVAGIRDARHRVRARTRDPHSLLSMVGGGDLAVATGVLLGAAARRTPVLIDGPVAVAAGLVARDYGAQTRHWLLLPDHGDNPMVKLAADVLGVNPFTSLQLGLGEGATALATLPLINTALTLAAATRSAPEPADAADADAESIEDEIQRVVADSPTAEMPYVKPSWET